MKYIIQKQKCKGRLYSILILKFNFSEPVFSLSDTVTLTQAYPAIFLKKV